MSDRPQFVGSGSAEEPTAGWIECPHCEGGGGWYGCYDCGAALSYEPGDPPTAARCGPCQRVVECDHEWSEKILGDGAERLRRFRPCVKGCGAEKTVQAKWGPLEDGSGGWGYVERPS